MTNDSSQNSAESISKWERPRLIDSSNEDTPKPQSEEQVRQSAYEEGHKLGYQTGIEQASKEMQSRLNTIDNFLEALSHPFQDQNHQLAEDIASLAGKIAKSLVRRELRTEPETIMVLVRDTVSALSTSKHKVNVHLNPKNAQIIREIINSDGQEKSWNIIDDPLISHSDCKVNSQDSLIDTDLQARINLIITQFLGDERSEGRP